MGFRSQEIEGHCVRCGSAERKTIIGPHAGGHYSRIECNNCGKFIKWGKDPNKQKKSRKGNAELVKQFSKGYCEICLRKKKQLPKPQTLEAHHIIEVNQGGGDDAENIQIACTNCHRLIHHLRTYLGYYHTEDKSKGVAA